MTDEEMAESVLAGLAPFRKGQLVRHKDGRVAVVQRPRSAAGRIMVRWQGEFNWLAADFEYGDPVWVVAHNIRAIN